jgi:tetrahydromethanopterin S-methyltransferase subunit B
MPQNVGKFLFTREGISSLRTILEVNHGLSKTVERKDFVRAVMDKFIGALTSISVTGSSLPNGPIRDALDEELGYLRKTREVILTDCNQILETMEKGDAMADKHMAILTSIEKSMIPESWNAHRFPGRDVFMWIDEFTARINALNEFDCRSVNLGLLLSPESLLVACRQTAARKRQLPLEAMKIVCEVNGKYEEEGDLVLTRVASICGEWKGDKLCDSEEVSAGFPPTLVRWDSDSKELNGIVVPCFMTNEKRRMIFEAVLPVREEKSNLWWIARNPVLVLQPSDI